MPIQERYYEAGQVTTTGKVEIAVDDRAFRYGDGLFETILVRGGQAIALEAHLDRMIEGMGILGLDPDLVGLDNDSYRSMAIDIVGKMLKDQDSSGFGRLRLQVRRSPGGHFLPTQDAPLISAHISPIAEDPWALRPPLHLMIAHSYPINHSALSPVKTCNALPYIMAARSAAAQGYDDALLRTGKGEVAEATSANIFVVVQNRIITPWLGSGCLPGTMRARVIRTAQNLGLLMQVMPLHLPRLSEAKEIFITSAIRGLQPVGSITETTYAAKHHPIMSQIRDQIIGS
ncbi:MAG: aminotransferase class IV [Bacteroidia bacterium]